MISFSVIIVRDLRTSGEILSSSDDESECDDACGGCAVGIGGCVVHWTGGSVNTPSPQLIVV